MQSAGGRPAIPAHRRVSHPPFVQLKGPTVWTTLVLTLGVDGSARFELAGASPFPRHWIYDAAGKLSEKAGLTNFKEWYRHAFGKHTPWGEEDSKVLVTTVETALERELSRVVMGGDAKPTIKTIRTRKTRCEQGDPGDEVYLLLDGVLGVEVDGEPLAELGPGAILGERAVLEGGVRNVDAAGGDEVQGRRRRRRSPRPRRPRRDQQRPPARGRMMRPQGDDLAPWGRIMWRCRRRGGCRRRRRRRPGRERPGAEAARSAPASR